MIEDLIVEYHRKEEQLEDLKQDLEDNYVPRRIDPYEEYGVSRNDFFQEETWKKNIKYQ